MRPFFQFNPRLSRFFSGYLLAVVCCLFWPSAPAAQTRYSEDFFTTQFKDPANMTARWDSLAGLIKLPPFVLNQAGGYNTDG